MGNRLFRETTWLSPIFFVLILVQTSFGQTDSLALSSGTAAANGTVSLNLTLTAPSGSQPTTLQWTLTYSASNVLSISVAAGASATSAGKTLSCLAGSGTYTCVASGLNTTAIPNG